jgi:hypothetical protein
MVLPLALLLTMTAPPSPAGWEVHMSDCASGDYDYFFFADGVVISQYSGAVPVQQGRWHAGGDTIVVVMEREWTLEGVGRVVSRGSNEGDIHEAYLARSRLIRSNPKRLDASDFSPLDHGDCETALPHHRLEDPHAFLRLFDGDHPETHQRVLGPRDLEGKTADQLRLMRNEIFARYGLRFRDPALRARFERLQRVGVWVRSDVDAFLSDVERQNVSILLEAAKGAGASKEPRHD